MKGKIYKPKRISGFPEWLPEERLIELNAIDKITSKLKSYGFSNIETPAVEELEVLLAKGETDKEIYTINRLHDDNNVNDSRLGLHYDLTVPMARYVAQHFSNLTFPFKRYQIQKVWRGERPQSGRYREFYQCDFDVVNVEHVPLFFDAELPGIMYEILTDLNFGDFRIHISNRKILEGFFLGIGVDEPIKGIRIIDKLGKLSQPEIVQLLQSELGLSPGNCKRCLDLISIKETDIDSMLKIAGVSHAIMEEGLQELKYVMDHLKSINGSAFIPDLSIARGFDYYTGTVYEVKLVQFPELGSVCSGGRYDHLCSSYINKRLPGVGMSIGLSRLLSIVFANNLVDLKKKSPTDILVIVPNLNQIDISNETGRKLRQHGYNVEVFHTVAKINKQLKYANKKGIPYVWFPPFDEKGQHEIKKMETGEQAYVDTFNVDLKKVFATSVNSNLRDQQ